jgi:Tfp pilus assembly protein PilN
MDWKKEYSVSDLFRRSSGRDDAGQAPDPGGGEASVWKKEIKLGSLFRRQRKPRQPALPSYGQSGASAPPAEPPQSIWKKEIKLGSLFRGKKPVRPPREPLALPAAGATVPEAPAEPAEAAPPVTAQAPPAVEAPAAEEPAAAATGAATAGPAARAGEPEPEQSLGEPPAPAAPGSVWKRELSFGRRSKRAEAAPAAAAAGAAASAAGPERADAPDPAPKQSFWKKELGGGRKPKARKPAAPARREPAPELRDGQPSRAPDRAAKSGDKLPNVPLMKALNLLPKDTQLAATTLRPGVVQGIAVAAALLLVGGVLAFYVSGRDEVADRKAQLADREAELTALKARQTPTEADDTSLAGEALARATALSGALQTRMNWDRLLRELSLTLPDTVWFTTMQSATPAPAAPVGDASAAPAPAQAGPSTLTISGYARDQEGVGHLLARLAVIPEFSDVQLTNATQQTIAETPVIQFSVVGVLKQPGQVTP